MAIRYRCPQCNQLLSIASRMAGNRVPCPKCGAETTVPDEDQLQPAEESAAGTELQEADDAAGDLTEDVSPQTETHDESTYSPAAGELAARERSAEPSGAAPAEEMAGGHDTVDKSPNAVAKRERDDDGVLTLRKPETDFEGIDMTPMVDVTFLLLIFFMITASFSLQKTIQVPPPDPERQGAVQSLQTLEDLELTSVIVQIDENNAIFVDYDVIDDRSSLPDLLRDKLLNDQKTELVLQADPRAFHETVVAVVDAANEVQFQKIRLATLAGEGR